MHHHIGNLFELYEEVSAKVIEEEKQCPDKVIHIIFHGCNAQGKMGSGFAKELRSRFPGAYDEYEKTHKSTGLMLGSNVYFNPDDKENVIISNCITQERYGYDGKKYVSYDAIDLCMKNLNELIGLLETNVHVHFPKVGADLGGGDWNIIKSIIETNLTNGTKHLYTLV